jgi:hypothetical protein
VDAVRDRRDDAVRLGNLDLDRIAHELAGERLDLRRERGREQPGLAILARQVTEDALDRGQEAHVEHAVGFVEDQHFDVRQVDAATLEVVDQAARRGDDDFDATTQGIDLRLHADATEDGGRTHAEVLAIGAHAFVHLRREFTRRGQHQRTRRLRLRLAALGDIEMVEQGQRERSRLAGTGLCAGEQVATLQGDRNRLCLDRGGRGVALFGKRAQQRGRKPECFKRHWKAPGEKTTHGCAVLLSDHGRSENPPAFPETALQATTIGGSQRPERSWIPSLQRREPSG